MTGVGGEKMSLEDARRAAGFYSENKESVIHATTTLFCLVTFLSP
jgi:hypothetical protein